MPAVGIVCVCALLCAFWLAAPDKAKAAVTVEELVANVRQAAGTRPPEMGFRQQITLQALILRWQFSADVVRRDDTVQIQVHGAPSFVDENVTASLLEVSEGLDNFDLRLVDEVRMGGQQYYVVEGVSRVANGARRGKIWVNAQSWLVERAELEYSWGTLTVEQRFRTVNGYVVLAEQQASVSRLGARMTVRYENYWFAGGE